MCKILGTCLLVLLLTGPAVAGEMPNEAPAPPPASANGIMPNDAPDSLTQIALELLAVLL